jgi:hypothetical protein
MSASDSGAGFDPNAPSIDRSEDPNFGMAPSDSGAGFDPNAPSIDRSEDPNFGMSPSEPAASSGMSMTDALAASEGPPVTAEEIKAINDFLNTPRDMINPKFVSGGVQVLAGLGVLASIALGPKLDAIGKGIGGLSLILSGSVQIFEASNQPFVNESPAQFGADVFNNIFSVRVPKF